MRLSNLVSVLILVVATQVIAQEPACDKNSDSVPFDFYVGVAKSRQTFAQPTGPDFGLLSTAIPIVEAPSSVEATRLCNGNIVAVWLVDSSHPGEFLTGRIFGGDLTARSESFRVTERDEQQWEHSVGRLQRGGFVVTWKTFVDDKNKQSGGIKIRARVFDSTGHAVSRSIDVSISAGNHGQASVYGFPNGDFVVVWRLFKTGVMLRVFDQLGRPRSAETLVLKEDDPRDGMVPYGYITPSGVLNLFLRRFGGLIDKTAFRYARSYDARGFPLTDVLPAASLSTLDGYQSAVERFVRQEAHKLELTKREFQEKDVMGFRFCRLEFSSNIIVAARIKRLSKSSAIQNFAVSYCELYRDSCPMNKYTTKDLEECLQD